MNYYEHHVGDYLKDTAHLSLLEHGVYLRLMHQYYTREAAIPERDAGRLIGARSREERTALQSVLEEFFVLENGLYTQARCDREIARFLDKKKKAKASANARWGAERSASDGNANASAEDDASRMPSHSEGNATRARIPHTTHQSPVTNKEKSAPAAVGFDAFWNAWPSNRRKASKSKCVAVWHRNSLDAVADQILAHVTAMAVSADWRKEAGKYVPAPLTYLNGARWDGAELPEPTVNGKSHSTVLHADEQFGLEP